MDSKILEFIKIYELFCSVKCTNTLGVFNSTLCITVTSYAVRNDIWKRELKSLHLNIIHLQSHCMSIMWNYNCTSAMVVVQCVEKSDHLSEQHFLT